MNKIKKLFLYIFFFIFILLLILSSFYSLLIYKPNQTLRIIDKTFLYNYSVDFKFIDSNKSLLNPNFLMEEVTLKNRNNNVIAFIPSLRIGINIYESLTQPHLSLSLLEIDGVRFFQNNSGDSYKKPFLIKGRNLKFLADDIEIETKAFSLFFSEKNIKAIIHQGSINSYPFVKIEAIFDPKLESIYYSSKHSFDSKSLSKNNLFDFKAFKSHDINLAFSSKGVFNLETKEFKRFDKLMFKDSKLLNNSGYMIDKINATIYSGKNSLYGLFKSYALDQIIAGSLELNSNKDFKIRADIALDMSVLIDPNRYFDMSGNETFSAVMQISKEKTSVNLFSNLMNTKISSSINDLKKERNKILKTGIFIDDISKPVYKIKNKNIEASISPKGHGFFSFGSGFKKIIEKTDHRDGFYIYLDLEEVDLNNIFIDTSSDDNSQLKSIKIKLKELNFLKNKYIDQYLDVVFKNETIITMMGKNLNGTIKIDQTNFVKINLNNTRFNIDEINFMQSSSIRDINNINLRFIGTNIRIQDDLVQNIDLYLLRNKNILTIDNIKIDSTILKIGPNSDNQKAYISFNKDLDLFKIKGKFRVNNSSGYFDNLSKNRFNFLQTDLNIQWNSLSYLRNLEGEVNFLVKDFELDDDITESTFLRAMRVLNLNAIVDSLDESSKSLLNINRASGKFIIGKKRAFIESPILFETDDASLKWNGEIKKNKQGELDKLNLELSLRLKISENIPWYAAIIGGIPAIAGGLVFENIFEDTIEDISTINFDVQGTIDKPKVIRLN